MRRIGIAFLAVAALGGSAAGAQAAVTVGLSDQNASMFDDPRFAALGVGTVRLVTPWDSVSTEPGRLDAWLSAAHRAGQEVLVAFEHRRADNCPGSPCLAPTPSEYGAAFDEFRARYPWVHLITPWNEANHPWQPTYSDPQLAAEYYNEVSRRCPDCTVVAADVLDSPNMATWLSTFMRFAEGNPQIWGLHDYGDANDFTDSGLRTILNMTQGQVWLTETGGLVRLVRDDGFLRYPYDEDRAARAIKYVAGLAESAAPRVPRVYFYNWQARIEQPDFDTGLLGPDGNSRPGLYAVADLMGRSAAVKAAEGSGPVAAPAAAQSPSAGAKPAGLAKTTLQPSDFRTRARILHRSRRAVKVEIECARWSGCRGAVAVRTRRHELGRALFAVGPDMRVTVAVAIGRKQRRWKARHPHLRTRADLLLQ